MVEERKEKDSKGRDSYAESDVDVAVGSRDFFRSDRTREGTNAATGKDWNYRGEEGAVGV